MATALEPIDKVHTECADFARNVYEKGVSILRPGVSFPDVANAIFTMPTQKPSKRCFSITFLRVPLLFSNRCTCIPGSLLSLRDSACCSGKAPVR
jgi:hypothetical protein